jgi:hypothetical protein
MTPNQLRKATLLYARFLRLKRTPGLTAAERSQLFWLRTQLEDLGMTSLDTHPHEPDTARTNGQ